MEKMPGKILFYLVVLLLVTVSLKMSQSTSSAEGMPPGQGQEQEHSEDEHNHGGEVPPGIPVLLEFTSPTCDICKQIAPMIHKLGQEYTGRVAFVEISVSDNDKEAQQLAAEYGVQSFPTFFVLNNRDERQILTKFEGGVPEDMIRKVLDSLPKMKQAPPK